MNVRVEITDQGQSVEITRGFSQVLSADPILLAADELENIAAELRAMRRERDALNAASIIRNRHGEAAR